MKKRFFCMSLILVMLLSVSAHAIQIRSITSVPHLSFDGNNASCVIQIVGDKMTDEISATMELRCGSDLIASWNGSGSGILKMTKVRQSKRKNLYHGCQFFREWNRAIPSYYQCHKWLKDE